MLNEIKFANYKIIIKEEEMQRNSQLTRHKFSELTSNEQLSQAPTQTYCSAFGQRAWLKNRGKQQFINFSDHALLQLRKYFDSLDQKQNGSIGVEQLQDPFIAFGLSETREQVQQLIDSVDLDGSGKIQFDQFLAIMLKIKRGKSTGSEQNSAMFDFFQKLSKGNLGDQYDKDMSFKMNVSQVRRKQILQSIMGNNKQKRQKGKKVMQSFKRQVMNTPQLKEVLNESKKSNIFMYGFQTSLKKKL